MQFSKPFIEAIFSDNNGLNFKKKTALSFKTEPGEKLYVKVGISAVDEQGAKSNLKAELAGWNFNTIKQEAQKTWENQLGKIKVKGGTANQKTILKLYSAQIQQIQFGGRRQHVCSSARGSYSEK